MLGEIMFLGVATNDWYRYLHDIIYVNYASFHYTNLVVFPEMSTQPDALNLPVSKAHSIGMQFFFTFIKYQNNFIIDDEY
jgi:hypothetical protein